MATADAMPIALPIDKFRANPRIILPGWPAQTGVAQLQLTMVDLLARVRKHRSVLHWQPRRHSEVLEASAEEIMPLTACGRMLADRSELRDAFDAILASVRLTGHSDCGDAILVTSTRPSEGKTTVAGCLAVAAALAGLRVLFIDGDLRRPSMRSTGGDVTGIGFGEMLDGETAAADTLRSAEFFDRERGRYIVRFLCAGRKSATFLAGVDWHKARTAFQSFALNFDFVLLDSPPILAANDALLFAGLVDRILLVIGANVSADEVRRAKHRLDALRTPIVGAVLNEFGSDVHGCPVQPYRGYNLS